ncbi:hypothetical protein G7077_08065 [Sphingomonas piscis]|uniref:Uncharacterized protein n=1 Tax=Sphingomonas piscis TaxID=2714943 RepID=A0A6G7YQ35_9SPHN|nr:hypothetical protein [Sphingomonas piscis]QIK78855.1 hypothetical protein G7077_08065 [Sphingomonas piscis]
MRKILIAVTALASMTAIAPASAQWVPQRNAYGQVNQGQARALQVRVDRLQRQIAQLGQRRLITRNEFNNLTSQSREIEQRLYRQARDGRGFNQQEANNIERRIVMLEQRIARDVRDGRQRSYRW